PESRGDERKTEPLGGKSKSEIFTLDLQTLEYAPKKKAKFATLEAAKPMENLSDRLKVLYNGQDKAGEFYRQFHHLIFAYVSNRIPEIADELYKIDEAMKAGFGWEIGVFESWDALGVASVLKKMKDAGFRVAPWVDEMVAKGFTHFYKTENGQRKYYDQKIQSYKPVPGTDTFVLLEHLDEKIVWKSSVCALYDIGDDVVALRWNTKMNSIGGEVLEGVNRSIAIAEEKYKGLVIA